MMIEKLSLTNIPVKMGTGGLSQFSGHHARGMVGENGTVPFGTAAPAGQLPGITSHKAAAVPRTMM
jgi:hypothetical protein